MYMQKRKRAGPGWMRNREVGGNKRHRLAPDVIAAATVIAKHVRGSMDRARYWTVRQFHRFYLMTGAYDEEELRLMSSLRTGRMKEAMSREINPRWGYVPSWR